MSRSEFKAFISYSHADEDVAKWVQKKLETWRSPRAADITAVPRPVFRDRDGFAASASLTDAIRDALANSEFIVVLCSRAAAQSQWVDAEIRTFRELGRGERVLGLVVERDASVPIRDCLPPSMQDVPGGEPLLADLREQGDGRRLALAKIIALLVDTDLGALLQREAQRRNRRLGAIAAGSLVATLTMAALTTFAFLSRSDALQARQEADARRTQAEQLISFMLGDLRAKLETVGRLDVLKDVGERATEYFASVSAESLSDDELHQRARSIRQFGVDRLDEGDLNAAEELFAEALRMDNLLRDRAPGDKDRGLALALSHYWVGVVHYQRNEPDAALRAFESQQKVLAELGDLFAEDEEIRANLAYVRNNIGMIQRQRGDLDAALTSLSLSRNALISLARDSEDVEALRSAVDASVNVGELQYRIATLSMARATMEEGLSIAHRMSELAPENALSGLTIDSLQGYLGKVLDASGDESAMNYVEARIDGARQRAQVSETDVGHQRDIARGLVQRSKLLIARQKNELAARDAQEATSVLEPLVALDESNVRLHRELLAAQLALAGSLQADVDGVTALRILEAIRNELGESKSKADYEANLLRWEAALQLGDVLATKGDSTAADAIWNTALTDIDALTPGADSELLRLRARLLLRLGREQQGRAQIEALVQRGWSSDRVAG